MWTADRKKLAQALLKVAVDAFDRKFGSAAKGLVDALFLAESKAGPPPTAEEGARRLLARGVYAAAVRVIQRTARDAPLLTAEADPLEIETACDGLAGGAALALSPATFADPASWPAMGAVRAMFEGWLAACRVAEDRRPVLARAFVEALPQTLAAELRDRDREADYAALLKEVTRTSPLDAAAQRSVDWQAYRRRLVRGVTEPLRCIAPEKMRKPFSLTDLYGIR